MAILLAPQIIRFGLTQERQEHICQISSLLQIIFDKSDPNMIRRRILEFYHTFNAAWVYCFQIMFDELNFLSTVVLTTWQQN